MELPSPASRILAMMQGLKKQKAKQDSALFRAAEACLASLSLWFVIALFVDDGRTHPPSRRDDIPPKPSPLRAFMTRITGQPFFGGAIYSRIIGNLELCNTIDWINQPFSHGENASASMQRPQGSIPLKHWRQAVQRGSPPAFDSERVLC
jgi:hypothetical protein